MFCSEHTDPSTLLLLTAEWAAGVSPVHAVASPDAALLAAAAVTADGPSRHLGRPGEQSELESLLATLLCSY